MMSTTFLRRAPGTRRGYAARSSGVSLGDRVAAGGRLEGKPSGRKKLATSSFFQIRLSRSDAPVHRGRKDRGHCDGHRSGCTCMPEWPSSGVVPGRVRQPRPETAVEGRAPPSRRRYHDRECAENECRDARRAHRERLPAGPHRGGEGQHEVLGDVAAPRHVADEVQHVQVDLHQHRHGRQQAACKARPPHAPPRENGNHGGQDGEKQCVPCRRHEEVRSDREQSSAEEPGEGRRDPRAEQQMDADDDEGGASRDGMRAARGRRLQQLVRCARMRHWRSNSSLFWRDNLNTARGVDNFRVVVREAMSRARRPRSPSHRARRPRRSPHYRR